MSAEMAAKKEMRKAMKRVLKEMDHNYILNSSEVCQQKLLQSSLYINSNGICCYLSMKNELQTNKLIESALSDSKKVYIPKVIGPNPNDMQIHEIHSLEQINNFPKSPWGIPEPPDDTTCSDDYFQHIDAVLLPGVAFDRDCKRLGHGKAYYDTFLTSLMGQCKQIGKEKPKFVGLALDEQIVDLVPTEHHDIILDYVYTPSWIFTHPSPANPPPPPI